MTITDTATPPVLSAARRITGVALASISGVAVAVQSRINGELGERLADGFAAAVVSFGGGLVVLLVLVPLTPVDGVAWSRCGARSRGARCGRGSASAGCAGRSWWPPRA